MHSTASIAVNKPAWADLGLEDLIGQINEAKLRIERISLSPIVDTPIHASSLAVMLAPVRLHRKRRNQSAAYHKRIEKKWLKRFGKTHRPCAYMLDLSVLTFGGRKSGKSLFMHPQLLEEMGHATKAREGRAP